MTQHFDTSRRALLQGGGALVVSLSIAGRIDAALAQGADAVLALDTDGAWTLYSGQAAPVGAALRQIVADEFDLPLSRVRLGTGAPPDPRGVWAHLAVQPGGQAAMEMATYTDLTGGKALALKLETSEFCALPSDGRTCIDTLETLPVDQAASREQVRCSNILRDDIARRPAHTGAAMATLGGKVLSASYDFAIGGGAPMLADLRASIDGAGGVTAWDSEFFIPRKARGNIFQSASIGYRVPELRSVCHRVDAEAPWTPRRMANAFANECFMDELAVAAGADPIEFRRQHLDPRDERAVDLLDRLAALSNWQRQPSQRNGGIATGRGVAYLKHELLRSRTGAVASIEVDGSTGEIHAVKFYVVYDGGRTGEPAVLRSRIAGEVTETMHRMLPGVASGTVVDLIERPDQPSWAAGAPAAAVVAPAIANALYDALGVRLRSAPLTAAKLRAAIKTVA